jgi:ribonuclease VapC
VIVVDSSALVAILFSEPDAENLAAKLDASSHNSISAATLLESSIVVARAQGSEALADLDALVKLYEIEIVPFDEAQASVAREAFRRFGKGRHKAGLNFGDCMSYALAKTRKAKLLCKGADFAATDATLA